LVTTVFPPPLNGTVVRLLLAQKLGAFVLYTGMGRSGNSARWPALDANEMAGYIPSAASPHARLNRSIFLKFAAIFV
jgi:hypothetical protein